MHRQILIFSFIFLFAFIACTHSTKLSRSINNDDVVFTAGKEDSISTYKILIAKYGKFVYDVEDKDGGTIKRRLYMGICKYSSDTIFLKYATKEHPMGLQKYLIVEASKSFLIQYFVNKPQRIFLRINKPTIDF